MIIVFDWVANDVARWTTNQSKDIAGIAGCVSQFSTTVESLKSQLSDERQKNKEASSRVASTKKEAAAERQTSASMKRQYEAKLKVRDEVYICCFSSVNITDACNSCVSSLSLCRSVCLSVCLSVTH